MQLEFQDYLKTKRLMFDENRGELHTYPARLSVGGGMYYREPYEVLAGYILSWLIHIGFKGKLGVSDKQDSKDFSLKFIKYAKNKGVFVSAELQQELDVYYKDNMPYNIGIEQLEVAIMDLRCEKVKI